MRNNLDKNRLTKDLFQQELKEMIDLNHRLCLLADQFTWKSLDDNFAKLFTERTGRSSKSIRLIAGLFYLKSLYNTSDEALVATWLENPYWQYFCGERYFQHKFPINPSSLSKWRKQMGADGIEKLLEILVLFAFSNGFIKTDELSQVVVDTTVQEKYVTFPTDSKLYHKARMKLLDLAKLLGIQLRQTYVRVGKRAYLMSGRYGHARQYKRMKKEIRKLKCYLRRVVRDIERKALKANIDHTHLNELLTKANQLLQQSKQSKNKLYSLHAPEVECIAKGKVHKKYEFGVKVGIVTTLKNSWVLASEAIHGNPYDGHTLKHCIDKAKQICNKPLKQVYVDRGYKGHGITDTDIYISGQRRGITPTIKRKLKRRSAIEPVIGHLKSDHRMGTNYLLGKSGDKINAICAAIGFNLKKLLGMMTMA